MFYRSSHACCTRVRHYVDFGSGSYAALCTLVRIVSSLIHRSRRAKADGGKRGVRMFKMTRFTLVMVSMLTLSACSVFGGSIPATGNTVVKLTVQAQNGSTFSRVGETIHYI